MIKTIKSIAMGIIAVIIATSCCFASTNDEANVPAETPKPCYEIWYVSAKNGLNCRREPIENGYNIIKTYDNGTELQIIGVDNTGVWWETWDGETQGWCHSTYLVSDRADVDNHERNGTAGKYLGNFRITGYTPSPSENGGYSTTALGDDLNSSIGWAIAVDPNVIPLNSKIYIEGIGYRVARDTGSAIKGNKIDVLTHSNSESYAITGYYDVYLVE